MNNDFQGASVPQNPYIRDFIPCESKARMKHKRALHLPMETSIIKNDYESMRAEMNYLYETHLHTSQSSACGKSLGKAYIKKYIDLGYQGIIVTDHFYHGNCSVDRHLPWMEWVNRFCQGYEDAANQGEKLGLQVFFGWEENFDGDEYLVYGLDKQWLLAHPEVIRWSRLDQYQQVRKAGGCVVQAHPFRQREYIPTIHLSTGCVDGVEAYNAGNDPGWDALAVAYAKKLGLPMTAGSDIHHVDQWTAAEAMGTAFDHKLASAKDYASAIRNKQVASLRVPKARLACPPSEILLPVDVRDGKDESLGDAVP